MTGRGDWIGGSPWAMLRLHERVEPGPGLRVMTERRLKVFDRHPQWLLTDEGNAGLLLPAAREELSCLPLSTQRVLFRTEFRHGDPWVRVVCLDRVLEPVFLRFCETTLDELEAGNAASSSLANALTRFRKLLEPAGDEVSGERIAGLFAELVVLRWLLSEDVDAVSAWRGPAGEAHDFVLGTAHLEVKALPASGARRFRVSGIDQLYVPPGDPLFLAGIRLAPGGEGGKSVADLADEIARLLVGGRLDSFRTKLEQVGCALPVPPEWARLRFSPGPMETWRVDEGFPRLVRSMIAGDGLPPGISEVSYVVTLEHAAASEVAPKTVANAFTQQDGCQ